MSEGGNRSEGALELRGADVEFIRSVYLPVHRFIRHEWVGSAFLLAATVVAIVWANSPWHAAYESLWHTSVEVTIGPYSLVKDLHHIVNDGLMALFFFVVGLEVKRELLHGTLSDPRRAGLPAVAAIGGMAIPALVYFVVVGSGPDAKGWAIPMATDIAFAIGVVGLLGSRVPSGVRIFLLALAVTDDLGAVLAIALFYTEALNPWALLAAGVLLGAVIGLQRLGTRSLIAYGLLGFLVWLAVLLSGVHATIAGVALAVLTPSKPYFDRSRFASVNAVLLKAYQEALARDDHSAAQVSLGKLEELVEGTEAPLERAERLLHPWTSRVVLPVFALANAGVVLDVASLGGLLTEPVSLGILAGLLLGKPIGVFGAAWLATRTRWVDLPEAVGWHHVAAVGFLAGIGFTVALFITELSFVDPERINSAKAAILAASVIAGGIGYLILRVGSRTPER